LVAIFLPAALRGVERLVDRGDDVRDRDLVRALGEVVAATRTAHARDELRAAQLAEELLEIGKRNVLALADRRERHRAAVLAQRQIQHRGDRKPALGREFHAGLWEYPINMVKYTLIRPKQSDFSSPGKQ